MDPPTQARPRATPRAAYPPGPEATSPARSCVRFYSGRQDTYKHRHKERHSRPMWIGGEAQPGMDVATPLVGCHYQRVTRPPWLNAGVSEATLDSPLAAQWTAVVHQVAREVGGSVVGPTQQPRPGRNYYWLPARIPELGHVVLVLNATVSLVGCQ